ncbi:MAG TPA: 2'-5' RNA ligase family protein [Pyrinomonadaceae bacterium]|jgi:2'-5' RNA ligase
MEKAPLILTAKMDRETFEFFDRLRRAHFPRERNHLAAHVTLFHHLPGERREEIEAQLETVAARQAGIDLHFSDLKFIGRGTIAAINSPPLIALRDALARRWSADLTRQDAQKFAPHVTIQNKTDPEKARLLYENLSAAWKPRAGTAIALELWHYRDGPWQLAREFDFRETAA